jgi:hypothetical protein
MKSISRDLVLAFAKFGGKIRIVTFVLTLVLFILAAGAPEATGSIGG